MRRRQKVKLVSFSLLTFLPVTPEDVSNLRVRFFRLDTPFYTSPPITPSPAAPSIFRTVAFSSPKADEPRPPATFNVNGEECFIVVKSGNNKVRLTSAHNTLVLRRAYLFSR